MLPNLECKFATKVVGALNFPSSEMLSVGDMGFRPGDHGVRPCVKETGLPDRLELQLVERLCSLDRRFFPWLI